MTRHSRELESLRMPEVDQYLESADTPTVLVPTGTIEQHGHHLCLGTDAIIPQEVCRRIAPEIDALVAPRLNYGASDSHAGYAGVAYLNHSTLATVLRDIAFSFAESGFTDVVFVNGHLTNDFAAKAASNEVTHDLPPEKYVYSFSYWDALAPEDQEEYVSNDAGLHANVGETSAVLAIDDSLVDMGAIQWDDPELPDDLPNPTTLSGFLLTGKGALYRASDSGTWGDPSEATAERGEEFLKQITDGATTLITAFQTHRESIYTREKPSAEEFFS